MAKIFICKHCKTKVRGKTNFYPIIGYSHGRHCPRRKMYG